MHVIFIKLFADDTSLFSVAQDVNTSASDYLKWTFQWKMSFNPDPSKQAQEIIFSRKKIKPSHPSVHFNKHQHQF